MSQKPIAIDLGQSVRNLQALEPPKALKEIAMAALTVVIGVYTFRYFLTSAFTTSAICIGVLIIIPAIFGEPYFGAFYFLASWLSPEFVALDQWISASLWLRY